MKNNDKFRGYTCRSSELVEGVPPLVDDDGREVEEDCVCAVLDESTGTVSQVFTLDDGDWFEY